MVQLRLSNQYPYTRPVLLFYFFFLIVLFYLTQCDYSRKHSVRGYLVPKKGVIKVYSNRVGVIDSLLVKEGALVEQGDEVAKVKNSQSLTTGVELSVALGHEISLQIDVLKNELDLIQMVLIKETSSINNQITQSKKKLICYAVSKKN